MVLPWVRVHSQPVAAADDVDQLPLPRTYGWRRPAAFEKALRPGLCKDIHEPKIVRTVSLLISPGRAPTSHHVLLLFKVVFVVKGITTNLNSRPQVGVKVYKMRLKSYLSGRQRPWDTGSTSLFP